MLLYKIYGNTGFLQSVSSVYYFILSSKSTAAVTCLVEIHNMGTMFR
jgi:hypothetical protein